MNLLYNSEVIASSAINIGNKSSVFGPSVDMRDCQGALFIVLGNTEGQAFDSSGYMHLQCSTYTSGGFANYGTTVALNTTHTGNVIKQAMVIDCYKPTFPFIRAGWYTCTGIQSHVIVKYGMRKAGSTYIRDNSLVSVAANISSS
jgi:hypothetical protein